MTGKRTAVDDELDDLIGGSAKPSRRREQPVEPPAAEPVTTTPTPAAGKRTTVQTEHGPVRASDTSLLPGGLVRRTVYVEPATWAAVLDLVQRRHAAGDLAATASDVVREALRRLVDDGGRP